MSVTAQALLLLYVTGFLGFSVWKRKELLHILSGAGRPAGYFAVFSMCGLLLAQALLLSDTLYPYTSWTMYTQPTPPRSTWDFRVVRRSGPAERLSPRKILPEPNPRPLMWNLYELAARLDQPGEVARADLEEQLGEILASLARLDDRRSPHDPIQRVEVFRCRIPDVPLRSSTGVDCGPEPIGSYAVGRASDEGHRAP